MLYILSIVLYTINNKNIIICISIIYTYYMQSRPDRKGVYNYDKPLFNSSKNVQIKLLEEKAKANVALIEGVNQERQRIAMAIHDSAGSMLTALTANLQSLYENVKVIEDSKYFVCAMGMVTKLKNELRSISNNLYPSTLQKLGLKEELKRLGQQIQDIHKIRTDLEIQSIQKFQLNKNLELQLHYITREIIDNVAVHVEADNV